MSRKVPDIERKSQNIDYILNAVTLAMSTVVLYKLKDDEFRLLENVKLSDTVMS